MRDKCNCCASDSTDASVSYISLQETEVDAIRELTAAVLALAVVSGPYSYQHKEMVSDLYHEYKNKIRSNFSTVTATATNFGGIDTTSRKKDD